MANTYCALYRKYRPESFNDVVGQNVIVKTLKNAIKNNHISHAYLFTGPRGTGKTSIAKILAKTINCFDLQETSPCNTCVSCTQIKNKQSVDIIEIDAASNNGVDEIREIRNKVSLVPSISKYKVYIIDEVHMLTTGAFNALLKTLEEPPEHIVFVLATTEPHKIPNTILSRCQRFDFKRINVDDIFNRLKYICTAEQIKIVDEAIKEISIASDGGMRDAISTLDQVISYAENNITVNDVHEINGTLSNEELGEFIDLLLNKNLNVLLSNVDNYYNSGKNIVKIIEEMVIFLKNILLYNTANNYFEGTIYNYQKFKKYEGINCQQIIDFITLINEQITEIKKSNIPKFLFELLLIKLVNLNADNVVNVNNVLTKIENNNLMINKQESKRDMIKEKTDENDRVKIGNKDITSISNDNLNNEYLKKLQSIRVSNTLSFFNKQITIKLRQDFEGLNSLLMDPDVSQIVSIILDGQLKAASDEYIVFVLETQNSTDLFNNNLNNIENVLKKYLEKEYKVIGIQESEWGKIKEEFNNKTRKFEYINETDNLIILKKDDEKPSNKIEEIFGESVEYEI